MATPAHSPREVFEVWLERQAKDARVVLVCDTDHLLADAKVLAKPTVVDPKGRTWQLAAYRGDDLRFRYAFRRAQQAGPTVLVLVGSGLPDARLDVSTLSDLLAHDESTEPLDLSLARYLGRFCPQINFPPAPLRHYREALLGRTAELSAAAKKITSRWGRPDDWGRAQVAALVLLAEAPQLALDDLSPELDTPAEAAAHVVRLRVARPELKAVASTVRDYLQASLASIPTHAQLLHWTEPQAEELAAFLVLRAFAAQHQLQNPTAQLTGLGLLPTDCTWPDFEPLTREVLDLLRQQGVWPQIEAAAGNYLTPKRVEKLLTLTGQSLPDGASLATFVARERLLPVRAAVLRRLALRVLAQPSELAAVISTWQAQAEDGPVETEVGGAVGDAQAVQAVINLLFVWHRIEATLRQPVPEVNQPPTLLDAYEQAGWHRLDIDLGQLPHLATQAKDAEVLRAVHALAFGEHGDDQRPQPGSLKERVRAAQHRLDERLAALIRPSADDFIAGARCSAHYLRTQLRPTVDALTLGNREGKVWILIFDGMRFDTWRFVVKPLLAEHFTVLDDRPHFCVPPSFTTVARASLLAGGGPKHWQGFQGQWTGDEFTLAARNFGLNQPEAKATLRLQKEAETLKARGKLNKADADATLVNILIYGISDECHDFYGDFGSFQEKIRHDLLGNPAKGMGGILDDLLRRIGPADEVAVISDHGFTELLTGDACPVSPAEVAAVGRNLKDDLQWRYAVGFAPKAAVGTVPVEFDGDLHHMAVGRQWFCREGTKQPARFAHGGCTLAEMVVPAARLKRVTGKAARVVLQGLPELITLAEDAVQEQAFQLRNLGTVPVDFTVEARTNLGEILVQTSAKLTAGESRSFTLRLVGRYRQTPLRDLDPTGTLQAVTLRLRHTNLDGALVEPPDGQITLPIQVKPKATKLDTDALAGLDDL
jgi:hypothetical protein